ncbi:hypothetical protein MTBSS4_120148 [Magnetospirillum sp. SS-4]|nr:hypothetical protein MTBSS4_120148 [Magnetospirillum sp. SS-4]
MTNGIRSRRHVLWPSNSESISLGKVYSYAATIVLYLECIAVDCNFYFKVTEVRIRFRAKASSSVNAVVNQVNNCPI